MPQEIVLQLLTPDAVGQSAAVSACRGPNKILLFAKIGGTQSCIASTLVDVRSIASPVIAPGNGQEGCTDDGEKEGTKEHLGATEIFRYYE